MLMRSRRTRRGTEREKTKYWEKKQQEEREESEHQIDDSFPRTIKKRVRNSSASVNDHG
jgi:hypothetical protein